MQPSDFTLAQADDLAHYFLGKDSFCMAMGQHQVILNAGNGNIQVGDSWRQVFRAAGVQLPLRPQYVSKGLRVMMGDKAVCTTATSNMAQRIAAALNEHIPDRRGI